MNSHTKENIIIIGGVGTAVNILEHIADAVKRYSMPISIRGVIIDSFEKGTEIAGVKVIGGTTDIQSFLEDKSNTFIFAMYKPRLMKERYMLMESLMIPAERYTNFIHPLAYVAGSVVMGRGNVILSNTSVNSNVVIGDMNIINSNVTIEHDSVIGNGNFFAAGSTAGARAKIVNHCFVGLNSSIREDVVLDEVFIGMHSLVLENYSRGTIVGVPAKPPGWAKRKKSE